MNTADNYIQVPKPDHPVVLKEIYLQIKMDRDSWAHLTDEDLDKIIDVIEYDLNVEGRLKRLARTLLETRELTANLVVEGESQI